MYRLKTGRHRKYVNWSEN